MEHDWDFYYKQEMKYLLFFLAILTFLDCRENKKKGDTPPYCYIPISQHSVVSAQPLSMFFLDKQTGWIANATIL